MRDASTLTPHRHATIRVVVLVAAAAHAAIRGIAYFPATRTDGPIESLTYVDAWLPLTAWAWIWIAGAVALLAATRIEALAIPAMSALVGMQVLWAGSYAAAWLFLDQPRSWITAGTLGAMAVFTAVLTGLIERPPLPPPRQRGR